MAEKSILITQALAIGESNVDVLDGKRFKFPDRTGLLKLIAVADGGAEITLFVGGDNPVETSPIPISTGPPIEPDNIIVSEVDVFASQVIQCLVSNNSGAANEVRLRFVLDDNVQVLG